tara:strand:- start:2258 stop:3121 length:864 start_codon:yes stop_codon:yes gene_type:complete
MRRVVHLILLVTLQLLWDALAPPRSAPSATTLWFALAFTVLTWQTLLWTTVLFFEHLDVRHAAGRRPCGCISGIVGKLQLSATRSEPSLATQAPVAARNMVMVLLIVSVAFNALEQHGWFYVGSSSDAFGLRVLWSFMYSARHYATADIFFYAGHHAMHCVPALQKTHRLHHTSSASCAMAGYYMSALDFLLEHFPIFISFALWRDIGAAWPVSICVGTWNLLATHSGWDLGWGPDPRDHWIHHNGGRAGVVSNLGIFLDHVFGTKVKMPDRGPLSARCVPVGRVAL